jgi:hypothetical protein
LEAYAEHLEFQAEYQLTAEPLKIDGVIIKKNAEVKIEKNIARIFKTVNILEYKSPEDYFSVYDFYKVLGYAYLYAALNRLPMGDLTVTVIESRYPRELFKYIREEEQGEVTETSSGIYQVRGYSMDIQIIESKKLPPGENLWIRGLNRDLQAEIAGAILKESRRKGGKARMQAYLYAVLKANAKTLREVLEMADQEAITLDEVLEEAGLTVKWEKRGEERGEKRGRRIGEKSGWEKAIELLKQGYTVDQLEQMVSEGPASF